MNICLNIHQFTNWTCPKHLVIGQLLEIKNTFPTKPMSCKEGKTSHEPTNCLLNAQSIRMQVATTYVMFLLKVYS